MPMQVGSGDKARGLVDGAGLCSPGRWPLDRRRYPEKSVAAAFAGSIMDAVDQLESSTGLTAERWLAAFACGKVAADPFPPTITALLRAELGGRLKAKGFEKVVNDSDQKQVIDIRLLQAALR